MHGREPKERGGAHQDPLSPPTNCSTGCRHAPGEKCGLVVSADADDGFGNIANNSGALYLFSFADRAFGTGVIEGTIGKGYAGGKNVDLATLEAGDQLGREVSLDADRIAAGAIFDDGSGNSLTDSGAVHLFSFTDSVFSGGQHVSSIGSGYEDVDGVIGINLSTGIADADLFFRPSLDGTRLAVGAPDDDGAAGDVDGAGAVYLFTFADLDFNGASLEGIIGEGYTGGKNFDLTLDVTDEFGAAVSLDGTSLAVGAPDDDGFGVGSTGDDLGAVYLFNFTDSTFSGASLEGIIGSGYTGGKNLDVATLDVLDSFGFDLSLDANRLAVGVQNDAGFGNTAASSGAAYLFSFADSTFSGGTLEGIVGEGYIGPKDLDLSAELDATDRAGPVSLDGNRLAFGSRFADGSGNTLADSGEVFLISFSDSTFSNPTLEAIIGNNFAGPKDVDPGGLDTVDTFGSRLSLDGNSLVLGARGDDGAGNIASNPGAAYLFTFTDSTFTGGQLRGVIGEGYTGGNNIDIGSLLDDEDLFGNAVSLDGDRLAVGVPFDDGAGNIGTDIGAVHLFKFDDTSFSGGELAATIGQGYADVAGVLGVDLSNGLDDADRLSRVSLDADRLALGSLLDGGSANSGTNIGAVRLFSFIDSSFNGAALESTIGRGYLGGKNFNLTALEDGDRFGADLSLDGNRLAVGAFLDDGAANATTDAGAVYLFSFADAAFTTPVLEAAIGQGYTGGKNLDVGALDAADRFGLGVSLDGNRLGATAQLNDGSGLSGANDRGAAYLFTFTDSLFSGGVLEATIGDGYTGAKNFDLSQLDDGDRMRGISLDGTRLALGADSEDGFGVGSNNDNLGVVFLFSFSDSVFTGATLEATLGEGYTGGKNLDLSGVLDLDDSLGFDVSLDGNRLVAGAHGDDGFGVGATADDFGAAHLFTFTDSTFGGAQHVGTIGKDYVSARDIDLSSSLETGDFFGIGVSLDGTQLAIGADSDDGANNIAPDSGAVYLFTFDDTSFNGGELVATIGKGYVNVSGSLGVDLGGGLTDSDFFGSAVSLDGTQLAVGVPLDDGLGGLSADAGAVQLFTFADTAFNGGTLEATIGKGYTGGKNLDLASLDSNDFFGLGVSLDGNRLSAGAFGDDGANAIGDTGAETGALYLFSFSDGTFSDPTLEATIGKDYIGGKNLDVAALDSGDNFGVSASLEGNSLVVGADFDDGFGLAGANDFGAAYLFTFADSAFNTGQTVGTVGVGYVGIDDVDLTGVLDGGDRFGRSLSLSGTSLGASAIRDDGFGVGSNANDFGAVHLFTFLNTSLSGGAQVGTIGEGYAGAQSVDISATLDVGDSLGDGGLSLEGNRLVASAIFDDGFGAAGGSDFGAAHLFIFSDTQFNGGALVGTVGKDYTGSRDIDLASLDVNDRFGIAAALDGTRLAIGADTDDGAGNIATDTGAVYLFDFVDNQFNNGELVATIGKGYVDTPDTIGVDLSGGLVGGDVLSDVSLDGNRLAIRTEDDGVNGGEVDAGSVLLLSFTGPNFEGAKLEATIGKGYAGGKNLDVTNVEAGDLFGSGVSLDGNRVAVGAVFDHGDANTGDNIGAVYLFSFTDATFSGGVQEAIIGEGYSGGKNLDLSTELDDTDFFGTEVSLDGTSLAVGAFLDDGQGAGSNGDDFGAVYLITFSDTSFNGAALEGIIGEGYNTRPKDVDLSSVLDIDDFFGNGVSLSGNRLAAGARQDDGQGVGSNSNDFGALHLFTFDDATFTNGARVGTIGSGYNALAADFDLAALGLADAMGTGVSIDGNRLAVVSTDDDGFGNTVASSGAVYLFSFADSSFNGPTLESTIGAGYTSGKNIDLTDLEANDRISGVSLDGTNLAVAAFGDDGFNNLGGANTGSVRLFTFDDNLFSGGELVGTIGKGYTDIEGSTGVDLSGGLADTDLFSAVSLDGNRLAVGTALDDGASNTIADAGAVRLFTFADADFNGAALESTFGNGYTGGKNVDVPGLEAGDFFGVSVSLDGNRLAVGVQGDDGAGNPGTDSGAVHLFTFLDSTFTDGNLEATVGRAYSGGKNIDVATLEDFDDFGKGISLDGNRLLVGARGDDGFTNSSPSSGAAYFFTFADDQFNNGVLDGIAGSGYVGPKDVDLASVLDDNDQMGLDVSLDGTRAVLGSIRDDGAGASGASDFGALHLITFTDTGFSGGTLVGTIGSGYGGPKDINLAGSLDSNDQLGFSPSLDGNRLAVSAISDDGVGNAALDAGAAYLFSFADDTFGGGALEGTIGVGYTGGKNVDLANLEAGDEFGASVSLDGTRLAIGAGEDDGFGNIATDVGAVYLFTFDDNLFTNGELRAIIGNGYTDTAGTLGVDLSNGVEAGDFMGDGLSLDGNRLAIGFPGDDAADGAATDTGAVRLFSFTDSSFGGAKLEAILGRGYTGGKNLDIAQLDNVDQFGQSLSLDGNRLAVGAGLDDGAGASGGLDFGAAYLFSFTDNLFGGGVLEATIGEGYSGGKNIDLSASLDTVDQFALEQLGLDGNRLVVGARFDDGSGNGSINTGAAYLFTFSDSTFNGGQHVGTIGDGLQHLTEGCRYFVHPR